VLRARIVLRVDPQPAGHAEVHEQRARPVGIDEQVLPDPAHAGDPRADQLPQRRARRLALHVETFAAVPHCLDAAADRGRQRATNGLDLGQLGHCRVV
jgi:hypothetical protein